MRVFYTPTLHVCYIYFACLLRLLCTSFTHWDIVNGAQGPKHKLPRDSPPQRYLKISCRLSRETLSIYSQSKTLNAFSSKHYSLWYGEHNKRKSTMLSSVFFGKQNSGVASSIVKYKFLPFFCYFLIIFIKTFSLSDIGISFIPH